jgi:hypothetical protein
MLAITIDAPTAFILDDDIVADRGRKPFLEGTSLETCS